MGRSSWGVLREPLGSGSDWAAGSSGDVPAMPAALSASVRGQIYSQVSKYYFFSRNIKVVIFLLSFLCLPISFGSLV